VKPVLLPSPSDSAAWSLRRTGSRAVASRRIPSRRSSRLWTRRDRGVAADHGAPPRFWVSAAPPVLDPLARPATALRAVACRFGRSPSLPVPTCCPQPPSTVAHSRSERGVHILLPHQCFVLRHAPRTSCSPSRRSSSATHLGGAVAPQLRHRTVPARVRALVLVSPRPRAHRRAKNGRSCRAFHLENAKDARAFMARIYHRTPWFLLHLRARVPGDAGAGSGRPELSQRRRNEHLPTPGRASAALPYADPPSGANPSALLLRESAPRVLQVGTSRRHAVIERPGRLRVTARTSDDPQRPSPARIVPFARKASG